MQQTQVAPPGSPICNQNKWRHLQAEIAKVQVEPPGDQISILFKWLNLQSMK